MSRPKIDWDELLDGYNEMYGLHYDSMEDFIKNLYNEHRLQRAADILGVSSAVFQQKMVELKIPREEKGHRKPTIIDQFKKLSDNEAFKLPLGETAKLVNVSNNHAQVLRSLRKRGYEYYDGQKSQKKKNREEEKKK